MKFTAQKLISESVDKLQEAEEAYIKLHPPNTPKRKRYEFLTTCLLDYYLTKISPMELAEYRALIKK